ncbi:MAG: hypothetical protein IJK18_04460 [Clostridia bacterium]|nr:hypothetical protein [Clostridia bacterium]
MMKKKKFKLKIKNPKRLLIFIGIIIILFLIVFASKKENIKQKDYISLIVNNEDVTSKLQNEIIIKDNVQYLSFEDIKNNLNENIYQEGDNVIAISDRKVTYLQLNKNKLQINGSTIQITGQMFKTEQGKLYLPISQMQNSYDIEFLYNSEYKNIVINYFSSKLEKATLKKDTSVKEQMNNSSATLEKLKKDNVVVFVLEEKGWAKIRTSNGNIGFIKKKLLKDFVIEREELKQENSITEEPKNKKDISKSNIKKYKNRKSIIQQIIKDAVNKKYNAIKIVYSKDKETDEFKKFKLEATAMLKENGITAVF